MDQQNPRDTLFQDPPVTGEQRPKAPSLLDQVLGVFTGPVPLFRRLAAAPSWGWALAATMALTLAMVLVWAARVDPDALLRPILARDPRVAPEQIGKLIEIQGRLLGVFGAIGVLVGQPVVSLLLGFALWLVGRIAPGPGGTPSYPQAMSAAVVPALVGLPKLILVSVLCLVRPVRGLVPDAISPLSLGFWLEPGQGRIDALLTGLDLFALANLVLLYLAARHILGLKPAGALACAVIGAVVMVGCQLLAAH